MTTTLDERKEMGAVPPSERLDEALVFAAQHPPRAGAQALAGAAHLAPDERQRAGDEHGGTEDYARLHG